MRELKSPAAIHFLGSGPAVRKFRRRHLLFFFFFMRHFTAPSLLFLKRGGRSHGDSLLKTLVQYSENWIYVSLGIQNVRLLGWDGCPLPQGTPLMQTWDFLAIF